MKYIKVIVSLVLICCLSGCGESKKKTNYQDIIDQGYLIVGIDDTFAPMGFKDDNGNIVGFDIDLAKAIGEVLDIEIRFQSIDWSMKETELNAGNIDLIWNGYSILDERKEVVDFSDPYLQNKQVIVVLSSSTIKNKNDLMNKTVAVQKESSALTAISKDQDFINSLQSFTEFDTYLDCFMDLDSSRSSAIIVDEVLANYIIKQRGKDKYRILDDHFGIEEYGIGISKENKELTIKINEALQILKDNGTYNEIFNKWF